MKVLAVAMVAGVIVVTAAALAGDDPTLEVATAPARAPDLVQRSFVEQAAVESFDDVGGILYALALADAQARAADAEARAENLTAQLAARRTITSGPPRTASVGGGQPANAHLASIRQCESGGNYATNTGNGFYGAYQFTLGTWAAMGGAGLPSDAPPAEQDARAAALYAQAGGAPWPVCQYR